tara:strand:- start:1476 stop:1958 length:483 start_codon:yes stop_codon:yes gene_type:complete
MQSNQQYCPCGKPLLFAQCCQPLLKGERVAASPELLMRSRFSAYVNSDYAYILATYAQQQRQNLNIDELQQSSANTQWLRLVVHSSTHNELSGEVEFSAFYKADKQFYLMHETSDFIYENGRWYYTTGTMHKDSGPYVQQRNEQCLCNSGKKYKKCCANS